MFAHKRGDIFESTTSSALGQCISSDARMTRGLAKLFVSKYPALYNLRYQNLHLGDAVMMRVGGRIVFNLITEKKFWQKPELKTLEKSLVSMKTQAIMGGIGMVSLPRVGCGLDRLNYDNDVKPLIGRIFRGSGIHIVVHTLVTVDLFRYSFSLKVIYKSIIM